MEQTKQLIHDFLAIDLGTVFLTLCEEYEILLQLQQKKKKRENAIFYLDKKQHLQQEIRESVLKLEITKLLTQVIEALNTDMNEHLLIAEQFQEALLPLCTEELSLTIRLKAKILFEVLYFSIESDPTKVQFIRALVHKELLNRLITTSDQIYEHIESLSDEKWFVELMIKPF